MMAIHVTRKCTREAAQIRHINSSYCCLQKDTYISSRGRAVYFPNQTATGLSAKTKTCDAACCSFVGCTCTAVHLRESERDPDGPEEPAFNNPSWPSAMPPWKCCLTGMPTNRRRRRRRCLAFLKEQSSVLPSPFCLSRIHYITKAITRSFAFAPSHRGCRHLNRAGPACTRLP